MTNRTSHKPPAKKRTQRSNLFFISIFGALCIVAAFIYQSFNSDGFKLATKDVEAENGAVTQIRATSDIRINEIMSANDSALYTEDGESSDWVELMNVGSSPLNLAGVTLAKNSTATDQFVFPDLTLAPGECVVVFCDSKNRNTAGYELHAPFSISRAGDTMMLFSSTGTAIDSINVPDLQNNESYAYADDGTWTVTDEYTPGLANTSENHRSFETVMVESPIEISELMAKNVSYAAPDGGYYDYIELHNTSSSAVDLSGYHLSDTKSDIMKWTLPAGTSISANGYLVIWCSGFNTTENGACHTSFKLSTEGETAVLANEKGQLLDAVDFPVLKADEAYTKQADDSFTIAIPPTPGMANTQESAALISDRFAALNTIGVYISEIAASTSELKYDWVELYNATDRQIDLSDYGLSDDAGKPRKWQFPAGTVIEAGGYLGIFCSGLTKTSGSALHADFKLSVAGGYNLCLSTSDGTIFDRAFIPQQFSDITYGRLPGQYGTFYYFTGASPLAENSGSYYAKKALPPTYSVLGGLFDEGETLTVALTAEAGDRIYYTTDCTDPTESSTLYTGPLQISSTTVLRTRVYADDALASYMDCQTYFFGVSHTMRVVSLVSDPYNLISDEAGIMVKGPNALAEFPYGSMNNGANFWMDWEREAHIEVYETDGTSLLSQECGIKLHGQYSRAMAQQAFKIYARAKYAGKGTFAAALFSDRDYTEYNSFLLRSSGQDGVYTRMRDSVLTDLADDTSVYYQKTELSVVYINGVYWGQYNMREHISTYSICQFEGWEGQEDDIDLVKANTNVMQGSNDTYAALLTWVKGNKTNTDEAYAHIGSVIDIQNFIEYMSVEIFTGNTDTLNVKRYRNANDDGLWRWCLFDLDWAFYEDTNSIRRWLTPGGMGSGNRTNNDLFIACMKNDRFRDEFLTYFGAQLATTYSTKNVLSLIEARYNELLPELPAQFAKWDMSESTYKANLQKIVSYAKDRPTKLIGWCRDALNLSDEEMQTYFGAAYQAVQDYENSGD